MATRNDCLEKLQLPPFRQQPSKEDLEPKDLENQDPGSPRNGKISSQQVYQVQSLPTKIGNPAPIGLFAFGMTTMMLMFKDMGWTDPAFVNMVFGYGLFYGGLAQLIAGFFELYKGNTFAATAFTSYGSFWLGWFMMSIYGSSSDHPFDTGFTLYFVQWGVFTLCLFAIAMFRKCIALRVVFGTLTVTFFMLAGGVHNEHVNKAAGYVGFVCGLSAFYTAFAEVVLEESQIRLPGL
eukprot:TRINITY_DN207_c2_g1_i2.p3 TRINITY_DN207_c2_g1~~TRINITY_DN207_c2_g1_i2.p3  ORF type:complete len:267 (-),score=22.46 TRINITY_DN207_c2_g1_i2:1404-2111(-)